MLVLYGILFGILGWVHVMILAQDGMIFGWIWRPRFPIWLSKITRSCEYCVAGQIALWLWPARTYMDYNVVDHILVIGLSIFTVEVINGIKENFTRDN